jgi:hypothetical protein
MMLARLVLATVLATLLTTAAFAAPARIIILRHGDKANPCKLCDVGTERANALADTYLGRNATKSLFANGEEPTFFFAITLHTLELAGTLGCKLVEAAHPLFGSAGRVR